MTRLGCMIMAGALLVGAGITAGCRDPRVVIDPNYATWQPGEGGDPNAGLDPNSGPEPNKPADIEQLSLNVVKTRIDVLADGGLACGDDLIAFGMETDNGDAGVGYVIPSQNPTAAIEVSNATDYDARGFALAGQTIFLAGAADGALAYQVSVYDVAERQIKETFATTTLRLDRVPEAANGGDGLHADGDYCVAICDQKSVADGKIIKVIDVSADTPRVVSFEQNPVGFAHMIDQAVVDAEGARVIVASTQVLFVYDLSSPQRAASIIQVPQGIGDVTMRVAGDYLIGLDSQSSAEAFLVDLAAERTITLNDAVATLDVDIGGSVFAFLAADGEVDQSGDHQAAAVGTVPGPGFDKASDVLGQAANGTPGYATSLCVTPKGEAIFLAGFYLHRSTGGASFQIIADPDRADAYGCPAWDVTCSANVVAFKTATMRQMSTQTRLGYYRLSGN